MKTDIEHLQALEKQIPPDWKVSYLTCFDGTKAGFPFAGENPFDLCHEYQMPINEKIYVPDIGWVNRTETRCSFQFEPIIAEAIVAMRNALPSLLSELASLRAIVSELAASNPIQLAQRDGKCVFCGRHFYEPHEADCLIVRAQEAIQ